jgi:hypothetical protein
MLDPFSIYGECGAVFPDGDSDEFLSLCLKAKPDYTTKIREIFSDKPNPGFDIIDAVGGSGLGWPVLQALLMADSARDILFALLAPTDAQQAALRSPDAWIGEAKSLLAVTLGLNLKTQVKAWSSIADELWRYLLFSEFVFDLPASAAFPAALTNVPNASPEARFIIEEPCNRLRSDRSTQMEYIKRAEEIEEELNLPAACQAQGIT